MSEKDWNARLKYTKIGNKERTRSPVICGKRICHGYVEDNYWSIFDLAKDRRIDEGLAKNNDEAKRHLKTALIALGAHFTEEVRATEETPIRMLTEELFDDIIERKRKQDNEEEN